MFHRLLLIVVAALALVLSAEVCMNIPLIHPQECEFEVLE